MAVSAEQLARELRAFDGRRQVVKALRRALNRAAKPAIADVRAHALQILPSGGGLNRWVAAARISTAVSYASRSAGVRIRGSRKSLRDKSDLDRIDRGSVRAPAWGRRTPGNWHVQAVDPGWFTEPLASNDRFRAAADREVDAVLDQIRRG